jgi:5-methylcytosine-specific restriction endonuclease McrA
MPRRPHRIKPSPRAFRELRAAVFERDGWACRHCGFTFEPKTDEKSGRFAPYDGSKNAFLELDHVTPYSLGGSWEPSNLQALCTQCNRAKWTTVPEAI